MKTPRPKFGYEIRLDDPTHSMGSIYDKLRLLIYPVMQFDHRQKPIPSWSRTIFGESVEITYQATRGEIREGTLDGPEWYGFSLEMHSDSIDRQKTLRWLSRIIKAPELRSSPGAVDLINLLESRSDVIRLAYSNQISDLVAADQWMEAEGYLGVYDKGISRSGGCILHAHIKMVADENPEDTDRRARAALTDALRDSQHCSHETFREWMDGPQEFGRLADTGFNHQPPIALHHVLGRPVSEADAIDQAVTELAA